MCPRCNQIENFEHKILGCHYVKKIWEETFKVSTRLNIGGTPQSGVNIDRVLCEGVQNSIQSLTLHAEILGRILSLRDEASFLIRPKNFVEMAVKYLIKREKGQNREKFSELY